MEVKLPNPPPKSLLDSYAAKAATPPPPAEHELMVRASFDKGRAQFYAKIGREYAEYLAEEGTEAALSYEFFKTAYDKVCSSKKDKAQWWWITISPEKDIPLDKIKSNWEKTLKKSWINETYYVYEYHTKKGNHIHIHALVAIGDNPVSKKREFANSWQKRIKANVKVNAIPYKLYEQKLAYISGQKSEEKSQYCLQDKVWRQQNNLKDLYHIKIKNDS